ncbi:Claspin [Ooceraea biroi]|uniref:Claspin n=1 Tax=Ooceraea biroi TaxID=2015173 RepID=A0A026WXK2_OOCBI|nr:Claspin [Ooceraea biroi]
MRQIHSESQRLLRETRISLPYHRPRQRTLEEFLNRKRLILPKGGSMARKMKTSALLVSQVIEERQKEHFFSSSDSEDEMEHLNSKSTTSKEKSSSRDKSDALPQPTSIERNQDLQRSCVSRKLFDPDCKNTTSEIFDDSHDEQESTEQIIEAIFTALDAEKSVTDEKKQDVNEIRDDEEVGEELRSKERATSDATSSTSNDCIVQNNENNGRQTDCVEVTDVSQSAISVGDTPSESRIDASAEEDETSDGHVLGLPLPTFADDIVTDRDRLLPEFIPDKVTLKGSPGTIIDLTHDVKPNKKGVNALLDRFFSKHFTTKKKADDNESEVTVIRLQDTENGPVPIKEALPYKLSPIDEHPELSKPGVQRRRLQEDLKLQMTLISNERWKQKMTEQEVEEKKTWDEEEESDYDFDEQEKAKNLELSESGESEPEEDDVCLEDKKRRKCLFADDEAEVTDDEGSNIGTDNTRTNIVKNKRDKETKELMHEFQDLSDMDANDLENEICTKSQTCKTPLVKTSMLDFVSPITQLSVLNTTLDSVKKDSPEKNKYMVDKHESISMESTQNDESFEHASGIRSKTISKKRLFDDIGEETIDDEYLMKLCSGKFESMPSADLSLKDPSSQFDVTRSSQLSELFSGNLNTKSADVKQSKTIEETDNEISRSMKVMLAEDSNKSVNCAEEKEVKEEEDAQKSYDEESDNADNENAEQYVYYDSEENEMIIAPEKDIKKVAADFLEEEAELSGSDWDSVDEDEKDLDKLEFEDGDDEHIDEHKVRDELGKIHMKQMLDEDKREVRLLKELLFEDGDLHTDGTGRERKFKWRNIDKIEDNEQFRVPDENDGWVDEQEDEEEAKWSKFRRERDKFIEERKQCSSTDVEDDLHDSKMFKLGVEALKKIENDKLKKQQDVSSDRIDASEEMEPIMPRSMTDLLGGSIMGKKSQKLHNIMKKRSYLARGEQSLARLASLAKQGDSISHMVNSRKCVFQYVEPRTNDMSNAEVKTGEEDQASQDRVIISIISMVNGKRHRGVINFDSNNFHFKIYKYTRYNKYFDENVFCSLKRERTRQIFH